MTCLSSSDAVCLISRRGNCFWLLRAGTYFVLACAAAGWVLSEQVIGIPSLPVEATYQCEVDCGKLVPAEWEALPRQEVRIASPFGYELFGIYIPVELYEAFRNVTWPKVTVVVVNLGVVLYLLFVLIRNRGSGKP